MNILILSWRDLYHPNAGGAEISTHEHAKRWVMAGHSVTLFTSYFRGGKREETVDGIKIIRSGRQFFGVHMDAFKWYLFTPHQKFDLVVDQFHGIPFFIPLFARGKKLGFIHEVTKEVWRLNPWPKPFNFLVATLGNLIEPLIFNLYKNIPFMTVSRSTKEDLISWGIPEGNITIIHNGVNLPGFNKLPIKEKTKTLIYLGALAKDKGVERALSIFSLIKKTFSNWQFWVVGKADPGYLKFLINKSEKLQLKVKFWGFVSEQKKFDLLAKAHLLINPSIREGWGLVVIEAAGVGTPTVAFNVAGLRDSIRDNETGILTIENTNERLALEVLRLMDDPVRYEKLKKNALNWSKKFTWERAGKESLKLLLRIAG